MGREIRRVPPNWNHPKSNHPWGYDYTPLLNKSYEQAKKEWIENDSLWREGKHPNQKEYPDITAEYSSWSKWDRDFPEDDGYYLPYNSSDTNLCTWYQVYETVSEGTPVTPPFATKEELIDYLANNGDFWDQERYKEGRSSVRNSWTRESAEKFVENEWAPTFIIENNVIKEGYK